ncbi:MAG: efflux RND transporter periplasmic adaptor subunit [Pirellulales bacterium]|nr:efflux RND transporter periplasmic adaptor subunit [Pirellulales bacterium]
MALAIDPSTRDASQTRLELVDDLVFVPQVHLNEVYYHLESKSQNTFYRIGYAEYVFISLLNGKLTIAQALTVMARQRRSDALSKQAGVQLCRWLLENGLARDLDQDKLAAPEPSSAETKHGANSSGKLNPFWIKIPFGNPDRLFVLAVPYLSWLLQWWATVFGIGVILLGATCLGANWDRFVTSSQAVFAPDNWLWLGLAWLGLKIAHEFAHGIACRSYGGEVRDSGAIFVLFAPLAYVDVTSSWRFTSKWRRIHVAVAGMYVELIIAAIAAIIWVNAETMYAKHLLHSIILMASLSTLVFNANPLMKFDGYYILSDLVGIPNLANQGSQFVRQVSSKLFFGTTTQAPRMTGVRNGFVGVYGIAAALWRVLICLSLATAASVLLNGAGIVLSLVALLLWFGRPVWGLAIEMLRRAQTAPARFFRAVFVGALLSSASVLTLTQLSWPGAMSAPAIVDYADLSTLRSGASGFVEDILVHNGQQVKAGQLLVELRNDELTTELRGEELLLEQEHLRHRHALDHQDAAAAQVAMQNIQALDERIFELRQHVQSLKIVAPRDGRILGRNLRYAIGTYLNEGDEVLAIGDDRIKELTVSVGQEEIDAMVPLVGESITYRIDGQNLNQGVLEQIDPRASTYLPHPALSSTVGGPLIVREDSDSHDTTTRESQLLLTEPRFRAVISLPENAARQLGAGEQGYALLGRRRESIGEVAWIKSSRWIKRLFLPDSR